MSGEVTTKWVIVDTDLRYKEAVYFTSLKAVQEAVRRIWFPPYGDTTAFHPAIFRLEHTEDGWKATQEPLQPEPVYWVGWKEVNAKCRLTLYSDWDREDALLYRENDKGGLDLLSDEERDKVIAEFKARQS